MSASNLIRRARDSAGMTQTQLAASMGVSQPVVARLERAAANPTYATLERALLATGHTLELIQCPRGPATLDLAQLRVRLAMTPAERLLVFTRSQRNLAGLVGQLRRDG